MSLDLHSFITASLVGDAEERAEAIATIGRIKQTGEGKFRPERVRIRR